MRHTPRHSLHRDALVLGRKISTTVYLEPDQLAALKRLSAETGVPMVSLFYDGEPGINQRLDVFLAGLAARPTPGTTAHHDLPEPVLHP